MRIFSNPLHFIATICLTLGLTACGSAIKAPTVEVAEVRLANIDRESVQLTVSLRMTNPNPIDISISDLKAELSIAGQPVGNAESLAGKTTLQSRAAVTLPMRVSVPFKALPETLRQSLIAMGNGALPYKISGSASAMNGVLTIPFEKSGEIARRR
ncbi:MAG: LEA type 2 family protein [Burkholderiaceae bacterium]|nr:LEA type 2 family protein [Burkholderiaceae bacterium]